MLQSQNNVVMPSHSHSSRRRYSMLRRFGSNDEQTSQRIGMAIGAMLILTVVAGLGLVVRGLF